MNASAVTPKRVAFAVGVVALLFAVWMVRPLLHAPVMLFYQYPLVTWMPLAAGLLLAAVVFGLARALDRDGAVVAGWSGAALAAVMWTFCMVMLPGWQGAALYTATTYQEGGALPQTTSPRLLPKDAAERYGKRDDMRHAHLAVDPDTRELVWSAEEKPGFIPRGASKGIGVQPLDRIDGTLRRIPAKFDPSISRVGPGSIKWRAYKRHFFTKVTDRIIVPLTGGRAIAVAPYLGYKGFPVRRPYLKGVIVYHQDGRTEDLTPRQALARPELRESGRLFPEALARDLAEAYGYKTGSGAVFKGAERTKVTDPSGNPQPYLTNLGDGRVKWVSVGTDAGDDGKVKSLFLTDAATGSTQVWRPARGQRLISNRGAERAARGLDLEWTRMVCCDSNGASYEETIREATEPRAVFADGRFYYLVSIIANRHYVTTREPVERTVVVDAVTGKRVRVFKHDDSEGDDRLRAFFEDERVPAKPPVGGAP